MRIPLLACLLVGCLIAVPAAAAVRVMGTTPANGARDVDPALARFEVRFSGPMATGRYSFVNVQGGQPLPLVGMAAFSPDATVCVQAVKLQPGTTYAVSINSERFNNFRGADGSVVPPYRVVFTTARAGYKPAVPKVAGTDPPQGATGVSPALRFLRVRFSAPMDPTVASATGSPGAVPQWASMPYFEESNTVFVAPMTLRPGANYAVTIKDFRTPAGAAVPPFQLTFSTAGAGAAAAATAPPRVAATDPANGAATVSPALKHLRVRFSEAVQPGDFSFVKVDEATSVPFTGEPPVYEEGNTVCVIPVRLAPGHSYQVWINADGHMNFHTPDGRPVQPFLLKFKTAGKPVSQAPAVPAVKPPGPLAFQARGGPPLEVAVQSDPRVELLGIIFHLAGNQEYNGIRVPSYAADIDRHFGPCRRHPVVEMAIRLRQGPGVSFDAPMSLAVCLDDALQPRLPLSPPPPELARWPEQELPRFLELARDFAAKSDFAGFAKAHQPLYDYAAAQLAATLQEGKLGWLADFFGGLAGGRFIATASLVTGPHSYGVRAKLPAGEELHCIMGVYRCDGEGLPRFDSLALPTVAHELAHSFTNRLVDAHLAELEPIGAARFSQVQPAMSRQHYGTWQIMMYETMVRACTARYLAATQGAAQADAALRQDEQHGFALVRPVFTALADYEANRDQYPTLESFFPRIIQSLPVHGEG